MDNQQPQQPQQPQQNNGGGGNILTNILEGFIMLVNTLGSILISEGLVSMLSNILKSHLDILNYIIRNSGTIRFWKYNLKYSLMLVPIVAVSKFTGNFILDFRIILLYIVISVAVLKIIEGKGQILMDIKDRLHYMDNIGEEEIVEEQPYEPEPVIIEEEEPEPIVVEEVVEQEPTINYTQKATKDDRNNLKNLFAEVKAEEDSTGEVMGAMLSKEDNDVISSVYDNIMDSIEQYDSKENKSASFSFRDSGEEESALSVMENLVKSEQEREERKLQASREFSGIKSSLQ